MALMILHAGKQKRHRHKGQTSGLSGRGEGGIIEENSTETYTLPYVKQRASASSVHEAERPKPVLWDNAEGWDGEGCRRGGSE